VKLPYRSGDSFALPLGNGEVVTAAIVACDHHVVEIAADEQRLRVYDEALVLHRWAPCHPERSEAKSRERLSTTALRAYARDDKVVGPAHAERIIASARGVAHFDDLPLTVYEVDDETSLARLDALPAPVMVSWSVPLAESALRRVRAWCEGRSETRLRLHSGAASQAAAFANTPLAELTLAGPFDGTVRFKSVRELVLDTPLPAIALERAFPNLRTLRIGWGARNVELMSLRGLHQLERLDLSHLELERADHVEQVKREDEPLIVDGGVGRVQRSPAADLVPEPRHRHWALQDVEHLRADADEGAIRTDMLGWEDHDASTALTGSSKMSQLSKK